MRLSAGTRTVRRILIWPPVPGMHRSLILQVREKSGLRLPPLIRVFLLITVAAPVYQYLLPLRAHDLRGIERFIPRQDGPAEGAYPLPWQLYLFI